MQPPSLETLSEYRHKALLLKDSGFWDTVTAPLTDSIRSIDSQLRDVDTPKSKIRALQGERKGLIRVTLLLDDFIRHAERALTRETRGKGNSDAA